MRRGHQDRKPKTHEHSVLIIADILLKLVFTVLMLGVASPASAQPTRYISDEFQAPVHEQPSEDARIVTLLLSGTPVKVLKAEEQGYSLIRAQGFEGWVLTHHLMDIPTARVRLARAERRFEKRRIALKRRAEEAEDLQSRVNRLQLKNQTLQTRSRKLDHKLQALRIKAAGPLATERQNNRLEATLLKERETVRELLDENDALKAQAARDWFLIGGGLALGSLLLGLIIGRTPGRRQRARR